MKKLLMLFIAGVASVTAMAQSGLNINALFDGRYLDCPQATETIVKGQQLAGTGLSLYHSLTLVDMPDEARSVEALVTRDGAKAFDREVSYRNGGLYYGFYQLSDPSTMHLPGLSTNRYILFLNMHRAKGNKIIVIYLEGEASHDEVKQILKQ